MSRRVLTAASLVVLVATGAFSPSQANRPLQMQLEQARPAQPLERGPSGDGASKLGAGEPESVNPIATATPGPSIASTSTNTPRPFPTSYQRPYLIVSGYTSNPERPRPGENVTIAIVLRNLGGTGTKATVIQIRFDSTEFIPLDNGGIVYIQEIPARQDKTIRQRFSVPASTSPGAHTIPMNVSYSGIDGTEYTDTLTVVLEVGEVKADPTEEPDDGKGSDGGFGGFAPTPTSAGAPQLIISSFRATPRTSAGSTDSGYLEPGVVFDLAMNISNIGNTKASRLVMVLGGAETSSSGLGGAVGNFSAFSPWNASNVVPVPDIAPGTSAQVSLQLIVNNTAASGAYNLQVSFVYRDPRGTEIIDDQFISLQVRASPQIDFGFYQPPDPAAVGQVTSIPLMLTNVGKTTVQLGQMRLSCTGWEITSPSVYVGKIEDGDQWFPPGEINATPLQAGPAPCSIVVNYQDDFGNPAELSDDSIVLFAEDFPDFDSSTFDPTMPTEKEKAKAAAPGGGWGALVRALLGFLGFDGASKDNLGAPDVVLVDPLGVPLDESQAQPKKAP